MTSQLFRKLLITLINNTFPEFSLTMQTAYLIVTLLMLPAAELMSKQSHIYNDYGSDRAIDGDSGTCMSTGNNKGAWWMRTWDSPVTFHSIKLSGECHFV